MNSKQTKNAAPKAKSQAKDLEPRNDAKGGVLIGLLLPAVQKVRGPLGLTN